MEHTYNVTTLNINKIQNDIKVAALKDFLYQSDTDIAFLQEVNIRDLYVAGYKEILNIAQEHSCGTAILVRDGIQMTDVVRLESGRGIRCKIFNTTFINVYAPSGNNAKQERAKFFTSDILALLFDNPVDVVIGGDWNCVLHEKDQWPNFNKSRELEGLVTNMKWKDAWEIKYPTLVRFTYITNTSQSRIDRIYVSSTLDNKVDGIEVIPTTFSDHLAVRCSTRLMKQKTYWGRPVWKLNISMLSETSLAEQIAETWEASLRMRHKYRSNIEWWCSHAKNKLRGTLMSYGKERARWLRHTVEFHYSCLRELYEQPFSQEIFLQIRRTKAELMKIKRLQLEGMKIKSHTQTVVQEENTSIYHLIKHEQHRRRNFIEYMRAEDDSVLSTQKDILSETYRFFYTLYDKKNIEEHAIMDLLSASGLHGTITEEDNDSFIAEISQEEVLDILKSSPTKKSPGPDGLPIEFYSKFWNLIGGKFTEIINETLRGEAIPADFKQSFTVLLPKGRNTEIKDINKMRPITLMNSDYKIIARVLKERLRPVLNKIIGCHQTCLPGRNILKTVSEYRDIISIFAHTPSRGGLAFIDFAKAFDKVHHGYLFKTLTYMGLTEDNVNILKNILEGIKTKVTVNGQYTKDIPIENGVPQGSPLSMMLFVVALEPFLRRLSEALEGILVAGVKKVINAYADDVGVIIRSNDDILALTENLRLYCRATGADINENKSAFLNLNGLTNVQIPWAQSVEHHTALGVTLYSCPVRMIAANWETALNKIRGTLILNQLRDLNLKQKIKIINCVVLSKAAYIGQILPLPKEIGKAIMTTVCRYIWQGQIFRVPVGTITLKTDEGGLGLTDIQRKTTALFIKRSLQIIESYPDSITAKLFKLFQPESMQPPININTISYKLEHIRLYYFELSYLRYIVQDKNKRNCNYIVDRLKSKANINKMEVQFPRRNWRHIWKNVNNKFLTSDIQVAWYRVVNRIVSTNDRLYFIGLSDTNLCTRCNAIDTLDHRFICLEYGTIWKEVIKQISFLKRSDGRELSLNLIFFPEEVFFPAQKNNAIVWLLGNFINYIINKKGTDNVQEYKEYVLQEYYKIFRKRDMKKNFGNMLKILFEKEGVG